jgi:bZIP Maf transcription factor
VSPGAAGSGGTYGGDAERSSRRISRDDRILASLGIPFSAATIINCSMEEFNSILLNSGLREEQVNTCRDMRRRGKNKIAAQNCRKRKVDQIAALADEVEVVRERKMRLLGERARLAREQEAWLERLRRLEAHILGALTRTGRLAGGGGGGGDEGGLLARGQFVELTQSRQLVS